MHNYKIYKLTNKVNGKVYIGLTRRSVEDRFKEHVWESMKNKETHFKIHQAIIKYGKDVFDKEILIENLSDINEANKQEIYYINEYDSYRNGYNMTLGGGGRTDYYMSEEARKKLRVAHTGKKLSEEHKKKISEANKGRKQTPEHIEKVRLGNIGRKRTPEQIKAMSERMIGKMVGNQNPAAIKVNIFDSNGDLKFECYGNFEKICKENGLPTKALRKSYYKGGKPIYSGKTIKKCVLIQNKDYIGWYAIKIS